MTLVNENEIHLENETTEQFLGRLARYINTSVDVMRKHYNESTGFKNSTAVQNHLEKTLFQNETTSSSKETLSATLHSLQEDSGLF